MKYSPVKYLEKFVDLIAEIWPWSWISTFLRWPSEATAESGVRGVCCPGPVALQSQVSGTPRSTARECSNSCLILRKLDLQLFTGEALNRGSCNSVGPLLESFELAMSCYRQRGLRSLQHAREHSSFLMVNGSLWWEEGGILKIQWDTCEALLSTQSELLTLKYVSLVCYCYTFLCSDNTTKKDSFSCTKRYLRSRQGPNTRCCKSLVETVSLAV